jgi:hypothetical protein
MHLVERLQHLLIKRARDEVLKVRFQIGFAAVRIPVQATGRGDGAIGGILILNRNSLEGSDRGHGSFHSVGYARHEVSYLSS